MALSFMPGAHRGEWHNGRAPEGCIAGTGPLVTVDAAEDAGLVVLLLDPLRLDQPEEERMLTPDEARALAAALTHYANAQECRWR